MRVARLVWWFGVGHGGDYAIGAGCRKGWAAKQKQSLFSPRDLAASFNSTLTLAVQPKAAFQPLQGTAHWHWEGIIGNVLLEGVFKPVHASRSA